MSSISVEEKTKFLIVDDRPENLLALESLLRRDALEIHQARSGYEALELLLIHDFALAILDVQMPEMSGFELAELMRGTDKTKSIPIIFVTAGTANSKNVFRGYESGAVDFIYKPLDPHIVRSKVNIFFELDLQRKLLRAQLQETQNALRLAEKAVQTRDEFLSIASHELRTPITSLSLSLQLLARVIDKEGFQNVSEDRFKKSFGVAIKQLGSLDHLIGSLLDVTRITNGKLALEPELLDLSEVVHESADQLTDQIKESGCKLKLNVETGMMGKWDRSRIGQVVINLLTNALKFGKGAPIEIEVGRKSGQIFLTVRDHGLGISESDQAKIFNRFERAVNAKAIGGLGLGLHIVKEIVVAHGGTVEVRSQLGEGAQFTITLPAVANVTPVRTRQNPAS